MKTIFAVMFFVLTALAVTPHASAEEVAVVDSVVTEAVTIETTPEPSVESVPTETSVPDSAESPELDVKPYEIPGTDICEEGYAYYDFPEVANCWLYGYPDADDSCGTAAGWEFVHEIGLCLLTHRISDPTPLPSATPEPTTPTIEQPQSEEADQSVEESIDWSQIQLPNTGSGSTASR